MSIPRIINCANCDLLPVTESNAWVVELLFQQPDVKKYYVLRDDHAANIKKYCQYIITANEERTGMHFIIFSNNGEEVGYISAEPLMNRNTNTPMWNVGYAILPASRRHGYASSAVAGLTNYLLHNYSIPQVMLDISMDNKASEGVALKCGYTCPEDRMGFIDWNHPEVGVRKRWYKQLNGNRTVSFNRAVQYYRAKAYTEAVVEFKKALAEPYIPGTPYTDAQIYSNIGMALSSMRLYAEAYASLMKARELGLDNPSITKELLWLKNNCGLG